MMEVVEVSDVDAIALHPMTSLLDLDREVLLPAYCQSYFAHPYSSWERGLNENTNGLIRQYFPKKTDFDQIGHDQIAEVESKLNRRPRKCLDTKTPNEIFLSN